jgi:hypothetical protein
MKPVPKTNHSTRVMRRPRRAWPPTARAAAAIIATAALVLLAAACSGSPSSTGSGGSPHAGGSASSPSAVAFSSCIRSHGVPNYPDPGSDGAIPKGSAQHFGVSTSQLQAAQTACQHLLPATGGSLTASSLQECYLAGVCPQALVQHALTAGRQFAVCMRSHGVPNWPDPSVDSEGRPLFNINVPRPAPPQVSTAISECERLESAGSLLAWG